MTDGLDQDLDYCAGLVQQGDPDRFACAMLAPPEQRGGLIALLAFNQEIAKVRETVREAMLGEIRLQWWRDVIAECDSGTPRRHQVVQPLAATIKCASLPTDLLVQAIAVRSRDFDEVPPRDEAALADYVDQTGGILGALSVHALLGAAAGAEDEAGARSDSVAIGRAAGRAWAWIGLARGLHVHRRLGRLTIPAIRLAAAGGLDEDVETARVSPAVRDWVAWLVAQSRAEIGTVDAARAKGLRAALAPARLARIYGDRLEAVGYDPFQISVNTLGPARRALALLRFSMLG